MSALKLRLVATAVTLAATGCASVPNECFDRRPAGAPSCASVDGGYFRFVPGEPEPDYRDLCSATCIDFNGQIDVSGRELTEVPLLGKIRRIQGLGIDVANLTNLAGLEEIESIDELGLFSATASETLTSLKGLKARQIGTLTLKRALGLTGLGDAELGHIGLLSSESSGLQRLDLSAVEVDTLIVTSNARLASLSLGGRTMTGVELRGNTALVDLSWAPGIGISKYFTFSGNSSLSSCTIQRLQTEAAGPQVRPLVQGNGPCP